MMPVLQGRMPTDYERTADALSLSIVPGALIGVGSMCRRQVHGPDGLIYVVDHLDRILPAGVRLHLFGVKGAAIPFLLPFRHRVASLDSQAYGISARRAAYRRGVSKTDRFVAEHMERWLRTQQQRLCEPARRLRVSGPALEPSRSSDAWESAIAQARQEIRALIESGDLDHDEITAPWIEQWAADIYRVERA